MSTWGRSRLRRAAWVTVVATVCAGLATGTAHAVDPVGASSTMARTWGVSGHVASIATAGDVAVVVGDFDKTLSPSGDEHVVASVAAFRPATGTFDDWPVVVDGPVLAVAVSGDTVYLGGDFRHVNGALRVSLAAVSLSTGALLPWAPQANVSVEAIAVSRGEVYIGGAFTTVTDDTGAVSAAHLARISAAGVVDRSWSTGLTLDDRVRTLLPTSDGSGVFVGGDFGAIGSAGYASRLTLLSTGALPVIDPTFRSGLNNIDSRAPVFALALQGGSLLVAAGGSGGGCALQDATTGATRWSYHTTGNVVAAAFLGPMSYCGGHFSGSGAFNSLTRYKIAEVVTATGEITSYAPRVNSALGVWALAATSTALLAGGDFTKVGVTPQPYLGMFVDEAFVSAPAAPGSLGARGGDHEVILAWDSPDTDGGAKIRTYKIYRALGSGRATLLGKTASLSYLDDTALNGTAGDPASTYTYYVRAVNSAGVGPASNEAQALPLAGQLVTPSAPQAFAAVGQLGVAELTWTVPLSDGGSTITGYTVYRGLTSAGLAPYAALGADVRDYTDVAVSIGTRYYYAVAADNAIGTGVLSKEASATPNTGVPGVPTLSGTVSAGAAYLSWTAPNSGAAPITKYVLVRDGVRVHVGDGSTLSFVDHGVSVGHTYAYKVKAVNSLGSSSYSDVVTLTI